MQRAGLAVSDYAQRLVDERKRQSIRRGDLKPLNTAEAMADIDRKRRFGKALTAYAAECWEFGSTNKRPSASEHAREMWAVVYEMDDEILSLRRKLKEAE